jgi:hypothetical protein
MDDHQAREHALEGVTHTHHHFQSRTIAPPWDPSSTWAPITSMSTTTRRSPTATFRTKTPKGSTGARPTCTTMTPQPDGTVVPHKDPLIGAIEGLP